jgi:urease accessory protein
VGESCAASLDGVSRLRGQPITASLIAVGASDEDLAVARQSLQAGRDLAIGMTLLGDLLVVRALAERAEPVLHQFRAIWRVLRPRLLAVEPCTPRIWAT